MTYPYDSLWFVGLYMSELIIRSYSLRFSLCTKKWRFSTMILKYFEKITWHQRYTKRHNDLDFIPPSTFSVPFNLVVYFSMTVLQKKKFCWWRLLDHQRSALGKPFPERKWKKKAMLFRRYSLTLRQSVARWML